MIKFGTSDSLVVPLVLPGAAFTIGTSCLLFAYPPNWWAQAITTINGWFQPLGANTPNFGPAIAAFIAAAVLAFYIASVFSGVVLAIVGSRLELFTLDALQSRRIGYDSYWEQWYRYVEHLEEQSNENVYVAGLADMFLFCLRSSVAFSLLLVICLALSSSYSWPATSLHFSTFIAALAVALFWLSYKYHNELASMRRRRFADPPRVVSDASELLADVLSRWCKREALAPLAEVLRVWPLKNSKDDMALASAAIDAALGMPAAVVYASERESLKSVKKLLDESASRA